MTVVYGVPSGPRITDAYIGSLSPGRGKLWTSTFLDYLEAQNIGSSVLGYRIPVGVINQVNLNNNTRGQLNMLPWVNLNSFSVAFDQNVNASIDSIAITGILNTYAINSFYYRVINGKYTASWFFTQSSTPPESDLIIRDKIRIVLSANTISSRINGQPLAGAITNATWTTTGDATTAAGSTLPSRGANGTDFSLRLNLVPGDFSSDTAVTSADRALANARNGTSTTNLGTTSLYSIFCDVTGDGFIKVGGGVPVSEDDGNYMAIFLFTQLPTGTI
jgi:hypothetical protein